MAVNNKTGIAGHDILPTKLHPVLEGLLRDFLPGFSVYGEYNLTPRAATQWAAAQTGLFLHNGDGPHKAVRDAITQLLKDIDQKFPDGTLEADKFDIITKRVATLYQFMLDASKDGTDGAELASGQKWIAYTHSGDPRLLKDPAFAGLQPDQINKKINDLAAEALKDWATLEASGAGQAIKLANVRVEGGVTKWRKRGRFPLNAACW